MTIHASPAEETPHSGFASLGPSPSYHPASAAPSSPAPTTVQMPNADGLALLQARRLVLLQAADRQKRLRRSKQASIYEAQLRAVTNEILNHGARNA